MYSRQASKLVRRENRNRPINTGHHLGNRGHTASDSLLILLQWRKISAAQIVTHKVSQRNEAYVESQPQPQATSRGPVGSHTSHRRVGQCSCSASAISIHRRPGWRSNRTKAAAGSRHALGGPPRYRRSGYPRCLRSPRTQPGPYRNYWH
jgi:hypothetical protein